jgi:acyl-coenzyme A thioesterase PaaI-like protein
MHGSTHSGTDPVQASWPDLTCYGCGPANDVGFHLKSYLGDEGDTLVATVYPDEVFNSGAPNVMYGGHIASLIDCHSIWTAITFAYLADGRQLGSSPRITYVTGELCVDYLSPTPLDQPIELTAWVDGDPGKHALVTTELGPENEVTATGEVLAVRTRTPEIVGHHQG